MQEWTNRNQPSVSVWIDRERDEKNVRVKNLSFPLPILIPHPTLSTPTPTPPSAAATHRRRGRPSSSRPVLGGRHGAPTPAAAAADSPHVDLVVRSGGIWQPWRWWGASLPPPPSPRRRGLGWRGSRDGRRCTSPSTCVVTSPPSAGGPLFRVLGCSSGAMEGVQGTSSPLQGHSCLEVACRPSMLAKTTGGVANQGP